MHRSCVRSLPPAGASWPIRPRGSSTIRCWLPRGLLWIARGTDRGLLEAKAAAAEAAGAEVRRLDGAACRELVGVLRPDAATAGIYEPDAMGIDVDGLLQGFLRGARRRGAELHLVAPVTAAVERRGGGWQVQAVIAVGTATPS